MLKKSADLVSNPNGDVVQVTQYGCGPIRSCSKCPCLLVLGNDDEKTGFCALYSAMLSDHDDYPKNCKVIRMTIEERL